MHTTQSNLIQQCQDVSGKLDRYLELNPEEQKALLDQADNLIRCPGISSQFGKLLTGKIHQIQQYQEIDDVN